MKLNKLALIVSSTLLSSSMAFAAGNAVLNVEGEIQINGKTVINNAGEFVGDSATGIATDTVRSSLYEASPGVYKYHYDEYDYKVNTTVTIEDNYVKQQIVASHTWLEYPDGSTPVEVVNVYTDIYESTIDGNMITDYSSHRTDFDGVMGDTYTGTEVLKFEELSTTPEFYRLGTQFAAVTRYTVESSTWNEGEVGESWIGGWSHGYSAKIPSHTVNGKTYNDCLYQNDNSVLFAAVVCVGVGEIQSEWLGQLVSYEPTGQSRSIGLSTPSHQAIKIRQDAHFSAFVKKIQQK